MKASNSLKVRLVINSDQHFYLILISSSAPVDKSCKLQYYSGNTVQTIVLAYFFTSCSLSLRFILWIAILKEIDVIEIQGIIFNFLELRRALHKPTCFTLRHYSTITLICQNSTFKPLHESHNAIITRLDHDVQVLDWKRM